MYEQVQDNDKDQDEDEEQDYNYRDEIRSGTGAFPISPSESKRQERIREIKNGCNPRIFSKAGCKDIDRFYRSGALICHPDRHVEEIKEDTNLKQPITEIFTSFKKAYDVKKSKCDKKR
jgi:hypothetical protein